MPHRGPDSRLLTSLLANEKEYHRHLLTLLDHSQSSLSSFTAFASSSAPPASYAIIAVAESFAKADDALRKYADAIDVWRAQLKELKDAEDDIAAVIRDREIL